MNLFLAKTPRLLFTLLLLVSIPLFVWAVLTQRIELRKKAATSEPPVVCWNRVGGNNPYYWPNGCRGNPQASVCTQATVPLTSAEVYNYLQWVNAGKPYIPGCSMPTPKPTSRPKTINWVTPYAYLKADALTITTGRKVFTGTSDPLTPVSVHSDPGTDIYTTLETTWKEQGVEMRMFIYFNALCTKSIPPQCRWNVTEIRTYDGNNPGNWIYFKSKLAGNPITGQYGYGLGTNQLTLISDPPVYGTISFTNLEIAAFTNRLTPTPMQTPIACPGPNGSSCTLTVCPTCTPGVVCPMMPCRQQTGVCQNNRCLPPTPPGCSYQTVKCFQAPCDPILVCPPTPTVTTATPIVCGGIMGSPCPTGMICQFPSPIYPDATGYCVRPTSSAKKPGDINDDGTVNIFDYSILLADFGKSGTPGFIKADLIPDGTINIFDYNLLLSYFGT